MPTREYLYSAKLGANVKSPKHSSLLANSIEMCLGQISFEVHAKYFDSMALLLKGYAKVSEFYEQLTMATNHPQEVWHSHVHDLLATFYEHARIRFPYMVD